jgi:hypothetical protein
MPDYFTLLRDRVTLKCRSIDRIFLQAYVPKLQTVGQVCRSHLCLCQGSQHCGGALQERTGQGENGASVSGGRRSRRQGPSRVDRHRSRENLRLAILEEQGHEKPRIRTWNGADRWPISITSISTSGTRTRARRSGRLTLMPSIRFGSGSTAMSEWAQRTRKSSNARIAYEPSTRGSVLVKIQPPCKRSATGSDLGR